VLFVVSYGLAQGGRASIWANLGILSSNAFYFALSGLGLGAVLLASHDFFTVIKYAGAAYLVYLGIRTILGEGLALSIERGNRPTANGRRALARGVALQAANPKAVIFFVALLPQFINMQSAILPQVAILGLTSVVIEFFVLAGYGYLAGAAAGAVQRPGFVSALNRASGAMLVIAGASLALTSQS
jgi:threonine/homoserine/homoserine lactone efflux protein